MRVKGYLAARGVEFVAIDVTSDPDALNDLLVRGLKGLPIVAAGERYVLGLDLARVDELLGFAQDASSSLPGSELVDRAARLLAAANRYACQLPSSHYDVPFPGMENVKPPFVLPGGHIFVLADGTQYVPHGTYLGLYRHIIGHGAHFKRFLEDPDADYSSLGVYSQFGEPLETLDVPQLAQISSAIADDIRAWWRNAADPQLDRTLNTFAGPQTLQQMLQRETYSLTQHTRQLMHVLLLLGIEPDGPIGEREYVGLHVPAGVWD